MTESNMRRRVIRALRSLDAVAVENPAHPGTPDVNFVEGWIELKEAERWPAGMTTDLQVRTFTPHQRAWLHRRWRAGGAVFLLLRVSREWLLFDGDVAAVLVGRAPQVVLENRACRWKVAPTDEEILRWLSERSSHRMERSRRLSG